MEEISRRNLMTGILAIGSTLAIPKTLQAYTIKDLETAQEGRLIEEHTLRALSYSSKPYSYQIEDLPNIRISTIYEMTIGDQHDSPYEVHEAGCSFRALPGRLLILKVYQRNIYFHLYYGKYFPGPRPKEHPHSEEDFDTTIKLVATDKTLCVSSGEMMLRIGIPLESLGFTWLP